MQNWRQRSVSPEPEKTPRHEDVDIHADDEDVEDEAHRRSAALLAAERAKEAEALFARRAAKKAEKDQQTQDRNVDWLALSYIVWPTVSYENFYKFKNSKIEGIYDFKLH